MAYRCRVVVRLHSASVTAVGLACAFAVGLFLPIAPAQAQRLELLRSEISRQIPSDSKQIVLVVGRQKTSADFDLEGLLRRTQSKVSLWERHNDVWGLVSNKMPARNGRNGWRPTGTAELIDQDIAAHPAFADRQYRSRDDLTSPIGVFSLTDAGGRYTNPGTELPYEHGGAFYDTSGQRSLFDCFGNIAPPGQGCPIDNAYNYGVIVNYNRQRPDPNIPLPASSDYYVRPLGMAAGDNIWLHVDHGAPTRGCISLPESDMIRILRWLDPTKKPVVVMGDRKSLMQP